MQWWESLLEAQTWSEAASLSFAKGNDPSTAGRGTGTATYGNVGGPAQAHFFPRVTRLAKEYLPGVS